MRKLKRQSGDHGTFSCHMVFGGLFNSCAELRHIGGSTTTDSIDWRALGPSKEPCELAATTQAASSIGQLSPAQV